ncbi:hypothetical protein KKF32_00515 [Patescibacteria group bacterium]|nr:hypothetical protein [Patescibacteria group bacterium]
MFKKFTPKVGKISFQKVAQKSGIKGLANKQFRKQAMEALHKAGYGKTDAQSIVSGHKKMSVGGMKDVFHALKKEKVIKKDASTTVSSFVKAEKARQSRIYHARTALRSQEIEAEKEKEQKTTSKGEQTPKSEQNNRPPISFSSLVSVSNAKSSTINNTQVKSGSKGQSLSTNSVKPGPDKKIKELLEEAEEHDLPID